MRLIRFNVHKIDEWVLVIEIIRRKRSDFIIYSEDNPYVHKHTFEKSKEEFYTKKGKGGDKKNGKN